MRNSFPVMSASCQQVQGRINVMKGPLTEAYVLHLAQVDQLSLVKSLVLSNFGLETIDLELFNKLTSLHTLDLSRNKLCTIPRSLCLPRLRVLDCSDNYLASVEFVQDFCKLDKLYIDGNTDVKEQDYYLAKLWCPSLTVLDEDDMEQLEAAIGLYREQLQGPVGAVWEAKFSEVYQKGVSDGEMDSLHEEFINVISKAGLIGSNLSMPKLKKEMISILCREQIFSFNKSLHAPGERTKSPHKSTPSKYGTRVARGVTKSKDYSSGAPCYVEQDTTPSKRNTSRMTTPNSKPASTVKRKREETPTKSDTKSPKRRKVDEAEVTCFTKMKSPEEMPQFKLPSMDDYLPSLFLRCHSARNDPADNTTKVWKCAFEPSLDRPDETSNIVATCGGNIVCLVDCQTGKVMKRYKDSNNTECFYSIAWTTLRGAGKSLKADTNILAVAGECGLIKLMQPAQLVMLGMLQGHRDYVSALVFHPDRPHILFSGARDKKVIMWDIDFQDLSDSTVSGRKLVVLSLPKTDVITLVLHTEVNVLVAGCELSCYGWKLDMVEKIEGRQTGASSMLPHVEFVHPEDDEEDEGITVDGLAVLPNQCIVSKCVGQSVLYLWDLGCHVERAGRTKKLTRVPLQPLALLEYTTVDVDYIYLHSCKDIVCIGDDRGNVHMFNLKSFLQKKRPSDELLKASQMLEYPELMLDKAYRERMSGVQENKNKVVVNYVAMNSSRDYLVYGTDTNLVCIWRNVDPV